MRVTLSRRAVADLLDLHQDSVSRLLPDSLACAVTLWGGRGKSMRFDRGQVDRWRGAIACKERNAGQPCRQCWHVLEDCEAVGEHLIEVRHGYGGCEECTPPGGPGGPLCQPCSRRS